MELDLEAIRQSPRQFVDLETVIALSDRCMALQADADEVNAARIYLREKGRLLTELAASQAREAKLRDALSPMTEGFCWLTHANYVAAELALALPQDTTALKDMIAKAGEVMREDVIEQCVAMGAMSRDGAFVEEIRALPGVTLDDIK